MQFKYKSKIFWYGIAKSYSISGVSTKKQFYKKCLQKFRDMDKYVSLSTFYKKLRAAEKEISISKQHSAMRFDTPIVPLCARSTHSKYVFIVSEPVHLPELGSSRLSSLQLKDP